MCPLKIYKNKKMKKILIAFCILFLLTGKIFSQSENLANADKYTNMAEDFKKKSLPDSALFYYEKASIVYKTLNKMENLVNSYNQMGILLIRKNENEKAKSVLNKALTIGLDSNNLVIATTYISLGVVYAAQDSFVKSQFYHNKALNIRLSLLGENHNEVATSYGNIGNVYLRSKDFDKSIAAHLKAKDIRIKLFGENSTEINQSYINLGNAYREKKDYATSLAYFEKALDNKTKQLGAGHKDVGKIYKSISDVYFLMDNKAQGEIFKSKADEISKK